MGANFKHVLAGSALSLALAVPSVASSDAGKGRLEWDKLSADQQKALKASGPQTKQTSAALIRHVYVDGVRKTVNVEGTGAQAIFRIEGDTTNLRHSGRAIVQAKTAQTPATMSVLLDGTGLTPLRPLDETGTQWFVQSLAGLEGIEAINRLQESGKVVKITPDWQRDLRTK